MMPTTFQPPPTAHCSIYRLKKHENVFTRATVGNVTHYNLSTYTTCLILESSFICRRCKGELSETRQVNDLHIDGHEYKIVDKFCYLGDMLSQEGGCEHAILKRMQTGWLKFRELSGLLIGKGTSLRAKGIIYTTCIRPVMLYGSDVWPTKIEDIRKIQRSEMRMLRWMTGVSLSERKSNVCEEHAGN